MSGPSAPKSPEERRDDANFGELMGSSLLVPFVRTQRLVPPNEESHQGTFASTCGPDLVELRGLEPLTPCMPCRCATNCATAPLPDGQLGNLSQPVCRTRNRPCALPCSPSRCTTPAEADPRSGSPRGLPMRSCPCPARS